MLTHPEIIDKLAARIRKVDGDHTMGPAELAESLLPTIRHLVSEATGDTAQAAWDFLAEGPGASVPTGLSRTLLDVNVNTLREYGALAPERD